MAADKVSAVQDSGVRRNVPLTQKEELEGREVVGVARACLLG